MTGFFLHGEGVHIGPERYAGTIGRSPEDAGNSVSSDTLHYLHPCLPKNSGHKSGSSALLVAELRLPVNTAAQILYFFGLAGHLRFKHLIHDDSSGRSFFPTVTPIKKGV